MIDAAVPDNLVQPACLFIMDEFSLTIDQQMNGKALLPLLLGGGHGVITRKPALEHSSLVDLSRSTGHP